MIFIKANSIRSLFITRILLFLLFFSCCVQARSQDTEDSTTVVEDMEEDSAVSVADGYQKLQEEEPEPAELRRVPDSAVRKLKRSKEFEYANDPEYWSEKVQVQETTTPKTYRKGFWDYFYDFFSNDNVRVFFYLLIGAILLFAIYRIVVVNNLYMSRRSRKLAEEEAIAEEIESSDPDERINKAIAEKNYRVAVRYLYLKSLQQLNEKGWIRYHAQATNYEYVNQVNKYPVASEFRFLTDVYDYVWYGEFKLTPEQFDIVYNNFKNFYQATR